MSKKKGASRSAMTLKDFHGGSIPSDLPLPSAPGMTVDRSVYERQGSGTWMSPTLGRGYGNDRNAYNRQGSSGGARTFEDKASYFPNPATIGRNYDEDERKPVESRPRSSHSADRFDDHHGYEERRGGYPADRFTVEDQGSFSSGPIYSEPRSTGFSDRFPPSQVTGSGFESDVYVHDEFGLIPVGPPPSRLSFQEPQPMKQVAAQQREIVETRAEQLPFVPYQQMPSVPPYSPHLQVASSPPRSWRNPSHPIHSSTVTPHVQSDSATNVWTARRDGDFGRAPASETSVSDTLAPSSWRPQGPPGKSLETTALVKASSGKWQSDLSRPSGAGEKRQQFASSLSDQVRESEYPPEAPGRGPFATDISQPRYSIEATRGLFKSDSGRGLQSTDVTQGFSDLGSRISVSSSRNSIQGVKGGVSGATRRDFADRALERSASYGSDSARQSINDEEVRGGLSETDRFYNLTTDNARTGHADAGRGGFGDYSDTRLEPIEQHRAGYRDSSRITVMHSENGRIPPSTEIGRESSWSASAGEQAEILERPKLKLLPRSKPLEKVESSNVEDDELAVVSEENKNNAHRQVADKRTVEILAVDGTVPRRPVVRELGNSNDEIDEEGSRAVERPKLNLKPRSQPAEPETAEGSQKVRQLVFGGARPRELVLKERGVDDVLNVSSDAVQTPGTSSVATAASPGAKWENTEVRVESRADDKQDTRRFERQERSYDRQSSHRVDRLDNSRGGKGADSKWDLENDSQLDQDRVEGRRRRDFDRQDSRRDSDSRRDIDKQDSWRRPAELSVPNTGLRAAASTISPLVDPMPRAASGRYSYSPTASAVELAQAYSRSTSIGSTMTGTSQRTNSMRSPLSPIPKTSVQGFTPGFGNGMSGPHVNRDAPFSRLAEASMPPFVPSTTETQLQGGGFGLESQNNFYGSGKLGGYGSGELKRSQSARSTVENDDFPGKRGLPIRQNDGYYD